MVGQEPVVQTLRNAVALGRVAHAYLFCGPRGTGKTSTARILAKAVNCLSPEDGEPDNRCEICASINEGRALDLIEIDAASNRGIDDIRNLREKVHYTPGEARYKVYIIDEAHMLTEPAFNALLKTLEEPPEHAIFVLATTEVHKLPLTIISRCQRFDFRRIPLETIADRLALLCTDEKVEASPAALVLIARASTGSLRDAENLLEQAIVSYGSPLGEDQVRVLLDLGSDERALELAGHILNRSVPEGIAVINAVAGEGSDLRQFHRGVMEYLRGLLLIKSGADASLGYSDETMAQMRSLAEHTPMERLAHALKSFAGADVRKDASSPLPLELALVESGLDADVGAATPASPAAAIAPRPESGRPDAASMRAKTAGPAMAAPKNGGPDAVASRPAAHPRPPGNGAPPPAGPAAQEARQRRSEDAVPAPSTGSERQWSEVLKSLSRYKGKRFNLGALLRDCRERQVGDGLITLKFSHRSHMERMEEELADPQSRKVLQDAFAKVLDGTYEIRVSVIGGERNGPGQKASQRSHLVRAAQAMGARVVSEKEEENEPENAQAGPTASEEHAEDAGGA